MMKFNCKIYLEAEDVAQSRILSTTSYVKNLIANCNNSYISRLQIDDENDLDDFIIRLYAEAEIIEDTVTDEKAAEMLKQFNDYLQKEKENRDNNRS